MESLSTSVIQAWCILKNIPRFKLLFKSWGVLILLFQINNHINLLLILYVNDYNWNQIKICLKYEPDYINLNIFKIKLEHVNFRGYIW